MQIQCLNKPQGNYVRRCWGTTPISGEVGLTARLHPLRRVAPVTSRCTRYVALHPLRSTTPVTSRYTRYVALHPLRRATPDQKGCIAYGSGAPHNAGTHHRRVCRPARITRRQEHTKPQNPKPHPQQRNTGSLATPHNPRAQPTNPTPNTTRPRPVSRPRPRHSVGAAQRSATDQAVMSTWSSTAARPASRRATGTRNGEQDT